MTTEFSIEMLAQIVGSVFQTMMGLEVVQSGTCWTPSEDRLTSAVHLAGAWNGAFLLECNPTEACRFAGRFLSMDPPEAVNNAVISVLGELANMIGGNMKCVMTPGIVLSVPSIVDGNDLHLFGTDVQDRLTFECEEGEFWVTVLTAPCSIAAL